MNILSKAREIKRKLTAKPSDSSYKNTFTVDDIKSGYILELDNGDLMRVEYNKDNVLGASGRTTWFNINSLDKDFRYGSIASVVKVYGRTSNVWIRITLTDNREVLWDRYKVE